MEVVGPDGFDAIGANSNEIALHGGLVDLALRITFGVIRGEFRGLSCIAHSRDSKDERPFLVSQRLDPIFFR